jgi:two-component system sensor histidine kinase HydH
MVDSKHLFSGTNLRASPWIFGAAAGLLVLIISVFAINNFKREKQFMQDGLTQEGRAVLGLAASASRDSLRRAFMRGEVESSNLLESVQQVIESMGDHPNLTGLYLVDESGKVLAHSNRDSVGDTLQAEALTLLQTQQKNHLREVSRILESDNDAADVFVMMTPFHLVGPRMNQFREAPMMRRMMGRRGPDRFSPEEAERIFDEMERLKMVMVAELDINDLTVVVRKQLIQITILSVVLLLIGVGGILSLMLLQGLRISQTRLARMATFTDVLVSSLPIGLLAIDQDGIIRTCNRSSRDMLELEMETVEGEVARDMLGPRLREQLFVSDSDAGVTQFEINLANLSGPGRSLHVTRVAVAGGGGEKQGTMLLVQDLSQVRKLEADLQRIEKDAAVGRMAAGVAHELRNPLSSIKGLALLLKSRTDQQGGSDNEAAGLLVDEVERLNRSISELLDYARPTQLKKELTVLGELVGKALTLVRADAEAADISITEHYLDNNTALALDRDKLTQVILNLCLNSIQAMGRGGDLSVSTRMVEDAIQLEISDTGEGIAPELLEKVFEPYHTTKSDGTGLGLAMSRKIIEDHGGSIVLEPNEHQGIKAVVSFPLTHGAA